MKKSYWTFLLTMFFLSTYGQTYNPLKRANLYWDVMHGDGSEICQLSGGNRYFFQGDTVISGHQYKIIRTHPIVQLNPGPYCPPFAVDGNASWSTAIFLREDTAAKQVYVYNDGINSDELFYDFTLNSGDTLKSFYAGQGSTLIVDSTGTVTLLNGEQRKIFYLNNGENYIESIGGSQGLQFPIAMAIGSWGIPTCLVENSVQLWGDQCLGFVGIHDPDDKYNLVKVFPNPSKDFIEVSIESTSSSTFTLFDLTGRIRTTIILTGKTEIISISELKAGTYIYYVTNEEQTFTGKLLVLSN